MAQFEPEVRAAALRRDIQATRELYTRVTPRKEAEVLRAERKQFLRAAVRLGVNLPVPWLRALGFAWDIANYLHDHMNDPDPNMWVQGSWTTACFSAAGDMQGEGGGGFNTGGTLTCPLALQAGGPPWLLSSNLASIALKAYQGCPSGPPAIPPCAPALRRYFTIASYTRNPGLPAGAINVPQVMPQIRWVLFNNPNYDPLQTPIRKFLPVSAPVWLTREQKKDRDEYIETISPVPLSPVVEQQPQPVAGVLDLNSPVPASTAITATGRAWLPPRYRNSVFRQGKERKFILAPLAGSPVGLAINIATETSDVIDAFFFAVPYRLRPKWPDGKAKKLGLRDKLRVIYDNYESIPMDKLFKNLLQNQIGDAIGGISGRINAKVNRRLNFATGLRTQMIPRP